MNHDDDDLNSPEHGSAIVQAQILVVFFAVAIQLWLLTVLVEQFMAGSVGGVVSLAIASLGAFIIAFGVWHAYR